MGKHETTDVLLHVLGTLSAFSSLLMIISYMRMKGIRKMYDRMICNIAVSNLFGSIGIAIGLTQNGTVQCYTQALLTNIFPISSVFWTTVIAYVLYTVVSSSTSLDVLSPYVSIWCWVVPVLLTLLPLTTNTYGTLGEEYGWCFIEKTSSTPKHATVIWVILSFYVWIWLALFLYVILFFFIRWKARHQTEEYKKRTFRVLYKLCWYPAIVLICWIYPTVYDIFDSLNSQRDEIVHSRESFNVAYITPSVQGLLTAVAFFSSQIEEDKIKAWFCCNVLLWHSGFGYTDNVSYDTCHQQERNAIRWTENSGAVKTSIPVTAETPLAANTPSFRQNSEEMHNQL